MNTYKKFSTYLLTHQPLLWHSMAIQLTLVVVLLNILFYGMGFLRMNLFTLKNSDNIESLFFNETFSLFWIISGIIILIIWGAFFYRNNAAKNFYPISRWYFHKLAVMLFIPALIYFMVPFSFFRGVAHQTQRIISESDLAEMQRLYKYSNPFLIQNSQFYKYNNRTYPEIYNTISYWEKGDVFYEDDYLEEFDNSYDYEPIPEETTNDIEKNLIAANAEPITESVYAFREDNEFSYTLKGNDTCWHSKRVFQYAYSSDSLPDFHLYHLKNFSIDETGLLNSYVRFWSSENYDKNNYTDDSLLIITHNWIDNKSEKIQQTLEDFTAILAKYNVYNTINPKGNFEYLLANDFTVHRAITGRAYRYGTRSYSHEFGTEIELLHGINEKKSDFQQVLAIDELQSLISNANRAYHAPFFYDQFLKYLFRFLALAGVLLLLYFEWGSILAFVISIPVAGAFAILGTLLFALAPRSDSFALLIIVLFGAFFLVMAYLALKGRLKPMIGNIAITLSYFMFPLWVLIILGYIQVAFSYNDYNTCDPYGVTVYPFEFNAEPVSTILLYAPFVLFLISLFAVKKVLAKK